MTQTIDRVVPVTPAVPAVTLREFDTYEEAQALVDRLSDVGFAVECVRIVGTGIHSVEQVTGRLTTARASAGGAATGAWLGLLIGLLFSIFVISPAWPTVLLVSLAIGIAWGAVLGFAVHWATRGRRDFASVRGLIADRYAVQVEAGFEAEAARAGGVA